jgi:hypothetical protein
LSLSAKELAFSYRTEPTLCVVGDNLNKSRALWKMYGFLTRYELPTDNIKDNEPAMQIMLEYVVENLIGDLNARLTAYGVRLEIIGGNLYLTK